MPRDVRGTVIDPALVGDSACCGLDGGEPNTVCLTCGTPVAIRIDDCGLRQAVWLDPLTTRVIEDGPGPHPMHDWADLIDQRPDPDPRITKSPRSSSPLSTVSSARSAQGRSAPWSWPGPAFRTPTATSPSSRNIRRPANSGRCPRR